MTRMINNRVLLAAGAGSPFSLDDAAAYRAWRQWKLARRPATDELLVPLENPFSLSADEKGRIRDLCGRCNAAIYKVSDQDRFGDKALVHELGLQFGLSHLDDNLRSDEDDITSLSVREQQGNQYIPYTNRPLSWHTDGYYNTPEHQVRGMILHCAEPAAEGGENSLIDVESGREIRGACSGPVFSIDALTGSLHMRYSARKRNILWRDDKLTREAAERITRLLEFDELIYTYRLKAGEGLICNNVLHRRSGFEDASDQQRLMFRARYYDRIAGTGLNEQA